MLMIYKLYNMYITTSFVQVKSILRCVLFYYHAAFPLLRELNAREMRVAKTAYGNAM